MLTNLRLANVRKPLNSAQSTCPLSPVAMTARLADVLRPACSGENCMPFGVMDTIKAETLYTVIIATVKLKKRYLWGSSVMLNDLTFIVSEILDSSCFLSLSSSSSKVLFLWFV